MRPVSLFAGLLALGLAGCETTRAYYDVPPTLNAATPPVAPLYRGGGDLQLSGHLTSASVGGTVAVSPVPHVGLYAQGAVDRPRLLARSPGLRTVEQSEFGVGATLYGPTAGALRAELTVGVATGGVAGYSADSVGTEPFCLFCSPQPYSELRRTEADRTRQSGHVTVAYDHDAIAVGLTVGLSRVSVSDVDGEPDGAAPDARGTFLDSAVFLQSRNGPGVIRLTIGGNSAMGDAATADEHGIVRGLGGRYRSSARPYVGLDVTLDLRRVLRPEGS